MTNPFAPQQNQAPQQAPQQTQGGNPFGGQQAPTAPPPQQPQQPAGGQDEFQQPGRGSGDAITKDDWQSWIGALVLFEPHEFREKVPTANGEADAVLADVHVIDVNGGPLLKENALVFPPALVTATKQAAKAGGGKILGRINAYKTKAGRDTFELVEHTQQDAQTASQYLQWRAQQLMQQPAGGQQQAPQQGGQPPF